MALTPPRKRGPTGRLHPVPQLLAALAGLLLCGCLVWAAASGEELELWYRDRQSTPTLERTAREHPDAAWAAYVLGSRYAEQGRLEEAMDLFERARALRPRSFRPHFSMGLGFLRLGATGAAVPALEQAAGLAPRNARVFTFLGLALRQADRYREAVAAGERSVKLEPRNAEAWYQLGLTYYRPTGQRGKGRDCFHRAAALDPGNAGYHRECASTYTDVGQYGEAEREIRESLRLNANDPVAQYLLGKILHRSGSSKEAASALREAMRLSPLTFQPHYELGLVLEERGDAAGALEQFRISSQISPRHGQSWFHVANAAGRLGRKEEAAAARARFAALTRDRDEVQYLERRALDHPEDLALRLRLASILTRNGDLRTAAAQCQTILARQPTYQPARALLAELARKAGQASDREPAPR